MGNIKINSIITRGKFICPLFLMTILSFSLLSQSLITGEDGIMTKFENLVDSADYYTSQGKWEAAEKSTIAALKLRPANKSNWLLWSNLAEIRRNLNDEEGALEAYNIGLSLNKECEAMLAGRAEIYIGIGEVEKALDDLDDLIRINPYSEGARIMRGWIKLGKKSLPEAEVDFNFIVENFPGSPQGYNGLAAIKRDEGKREEAIGLYSKSLDLFEDENIYFLKATLLIESDKLQEATNTVREGLKKFSRNGNLYLLRAYLHKLNFQNEEAEAGLKLARSYGADSQLIRRLFPKEK